MKICFCSLLLPDVEKVATKAKEKMQFSRYKFGMGIIKGLEENIPGQVTVLNINNTVNYPAYRQIIFKHEPWSHNGATADEHIGFINLFGIKYITQYLNLRTSLRRWIKKNEGEKLILFAQDMYLPSLCAILSAAKGKKNVYTCISTGDLTGAGGLDSGNRGLKAFLIRRMNLWINRQVKSVDSFMLVTLPMAKALGVSDKPVTVMEGVYAYDEKQLPPICNVDAKEKVIFNAGAIRTEYGISHLLRAFSMIEDSHYRLWIAGTGAGVPEVQEYAACDKRVSYLGQISLEEVVKRQQQATVLINPRTSEWEFAKYSFAGKNFECLLSGKPYIAHKLPCNPPEYDEVVLYPKDESDRALKEKIVEICELSATQRDHIAAAARDFVVREKSEKRQCGKIVKMLEKL